MNSRTTSMTADWPGAAPRRLSVLALTATILAVSGAAPGWVSAQPPTVINVEIDYMVGGFPQHSHQPSQAEIDAIVRMFACHGITLNVIVDDPVPHINVMVDGPPLYDFFTATGPNTFRSIKDPNFDNTGGGWHYCVFGHDYSADGGPTGSSGLAELLADDFVVTLGSFSNQTGTPFDRAGTLAHELGHNLGLRHSGSQDEEIIGPFKANYPSIMSYMYQLGGVRTQMTCLGLADETSLFKEIDYSNGLLPTIHEAGLSETHGVGIQKVDWDCSGSIQGGVVAQDLDRPGAANWCGANGPLTLLNDYNDWANIQDATFTFMPEQPEIISCVTAEEFENFLNNPAQCPAPQPTLTLENCISGDMAWIDSDYTGPENGTGDSPFNTVLEGYNAVPPGSVLYLQPRLFAGSGPLLLTKHVTLAGPGGAVVNP